jgi:hypothetical protein
LRCTPILISETGFRAEWVAGGQQFQHSDRITVATGPASVIVTAPRLLTPMLEVVYWQRKCFIIHFAGRFEAEF